MLLINILYTMRYTAAILAVIKIHLMSMSDTSTVNGTWRRLQICLPISMHSTELWTPFDVSTVRRQQVESSLTFYFLSFCVHNETSSSPMAHQHRKPLTQCANCVLILTLHRSTKTIRRSSRFTSGSLAQLFNNNNRTYLVKDDHLVRRVQAAILLLTAVSLAYRCSPMCQKLWANSSVGKLLTSHAKRSRRNSETATTSSNGISLI